MPKVQLRANHSIRITVTPGRAATKDTPAVRPQFKDIPPKALFMADEEMAADLIAQGAAKKYVAEAAPVVIDVAPEEPKAAKAKAPAKPKAEKPAAPAKAAENPATAAPAKADDDNLV